MKRALHRLLLVLLLACMWACEDTTPVSTGPSEVIPLEWAGFWDKPPLNPTINMVYFDVVDTTTYIFNGVTWDTMAVKGLDAPAINWYGILPQEPQNPTKNMVYLNSVDRKTYIFNGTGWVVYNQGGEHGFGIDWKGVSDIAPEPAEANDVYKDKNSGSIFIHDGTSWGPLMVVGIDGIGIHWLEEQENFPNTDVVNSAFYHTGMKKSFIFDGAIWQVLSSDGSDGKTLQWWGELPEAPVITEKDTLNIHGYLNSVNGNSYLYSYVNAAWSLMCLGGTDGKDGKNGKDGVDGLDGLGLHWAGKWPYHPSAGELNWVYYNTVDKSTYIHNGKYWEIFHTDGKDGKDAKPIIWKGELSSAPWPAEVNWAYYNTMRGVTYIYSGITWDTLCVDGKDAVIKEFFDTTATLSVGDSLVVDFKQSWDEYDIIAQYTDSKNEVHNYDYVNPSWKDLLSPGEARTLIDPVDSNENYHENQLISLENGDVRCIYYEPTKLYQGLKTGILELDGTLSSVSSFSDKAIDNLKSCALWGGTYAVSAITRDSLGRGLLYLLDGDVLTKEVTIDDDLGFASVHRWGENIAILTCQSSIGKITVYDNTLTLKWESVLNDSSYISRMHGQELKSGDFLMVYKKGNRLYSHLAKKDGTLNDPKDVESVGVVEADASSVLIGENEVHYSSTVVSVAGKGQVSTYRRMISFDYNGDIMEDFSVGSRGIGFIIKDPKNEGSILFSKDSVTTFGPLVKVTSSRKHNVENNAGTPKSAIYKDGSMVTLHSRYGIRTYHWKKRPSRGVSMKKVDYNTIALINYSPETLTITLAAKEK